MAQRKHRVDIREAVIERDKGRCTNCLRPREAVEKLDVDHCVPRGFGGSDRYSNNSTLCRQCHDAKEGDDIAPTVEFQSTGEMTEYEFTLFRQFLREMVPAMARSHNVRLVPKYKLDNRQVWHLPLGDVKRLDKTLSEEDTEYRSLQAADYM